VRRRIRSRKGSPVSGKDKSTPIRNSNGRRILWFATLVASIAVVGATAAGAVEHFTTGDSTPDAGVASILGSEFTGSCVTSEVAIADLTKSLRDGGYTSWHVRSEAHEGDCVAGGLDAGASTVILFPVQSPNITDTMHGVQADLMNRCLDKDQAIQYVSSVLDGAGVTEFNVLTDGPFSFPLGQEKEVEQHVADGCYVYSGSGHDAEGHPTYFLSGNNG
jgi:hypothetical protein